MCAGPMAGFAQSAGKHVSASLISETLNVVPGEKLLLGLQQKIETGWHTYWVNPGELRACDDHRMVASAGIYRRPHRLAGT